MDQEDNFYTLTYRSFQFMHKYYTKFRFGLQGKNFRYIL